MSELTHFSLFSGIGANDLAAEWAGFKTVGQCEWADFPTKVLEKHWPDVPRWRDIHDLTGESVRRAGIENISVLSGGFPCQPHSAAGKRKASADERDLWPEYRRVICETSPKWIVGENVAGLLSSESGRFFGGILRDLAEMGYDVGWCSIRASWVGAVHQRERVFIIAHANSVRCEGVSEGQVSRHTVMDTIESQRGLQRMPDRWRIPTSRICRVDDGVRHRIHRLKSLGNSIVPHQVYPIYQAIADIERSIV